MKDLGYGKGYKYAHDYKGAYTTQEYLPEKLKGRRFYFPSERGYGVMLHFAIIQRTISTPHDCKIYTP